MACLSGCPPPSFPLEYTSARRHYLFMWENAWSGDLLRKWANATLGTHNSPLPSQTSERRNLPTRLSRLFFSPPLVWNEKKGGRSIIGKKRKKKKKSTAITWCPFYVFLEGNAWTGPQGMAVDFHHPATKVTYVSQAYSAQYKSPIQKSTVVLAGRHRYGAFVLWLNVPTKWGPES